MKCHICGKEFEQVYKVQQVCSKACLKKKQRKDKTAWEHKRRARNARCADVDWLNCMYEKLLYESRARGSFTDPALGEDPLGEVEEDLELADDWACPAPGIKQKTAKQAAPKKEAKQAGAKSAGEKTARGKHCKKIALGMRPCHDCGKPTWDYRCPDCLTAWRKKNDVIINDYIRTT